MTRNPGELALESRVPDARSTYRFRTAAGVCSPDEFRRAELLLADALWDEDPGHVLVLAANYGVVPTVLADAADVVHATESSARSARLCERNAATNGVDVEVSLVADPGNLDATFDVVAYAPKPYAPLDVGAQRLGNAAALLSPGGTLFVAADPTAGLARYETHLREFAGDVERVAERDGCRVLAAGRPGDLAVPTYVEPRTIRASVDGVDLSLVSVPGVFAAADLDHGTRLLAETATVADGDRVLDLCCGYGALGAYAGAVADCEVWLTDDDRVATACAECSLDASGVDGTVITGDGVDEVTGQSFDTILCNPPTHAGSEVLDSLFEGARNVLATDGTVWVVHHRTLDLHRYFGQFDSVERAATGDEHVVLRVR